MRKAILALLFSLAASPAFAQAAAPISGLSQATTPTTSGDETLPIVQGGTTKKIPAAVLAIPLSGTVAPTAPVLFQQWIDTSLTPNLLKEWDGTSWVPLYYLDRSGHAVRPYGALITFTQLGIACDGVTDVGAAINAAITAYPGTWLDGEGKTCASTVNIMLRPSAWLRNFTVKDLLPTRTNDRIISTAGGTTATNVRLSNITIDRNGLATGGDATNSAGFYLNNITDSIFENLEVHGDGQGKGFFLIDGSGSCLRNVVRNLTVENMHWSLANDPQTEVLEGVRQSCSQTMFHNVRVSNLTGAITSGPCVQATGTCPPNGTYFPYQIHCFLSSGTNVGHVASDDIVDGLIVNNCATAVDNSGAGTVQRIDYRNVHVDTSGDFGFKVAHDARDISCTGCTFSNTGMDGFYVEDGKATDAVGPTDIICNSCTAINAGALYNYGTGTTQLWNSNHNGFHAAQVIGGHAMSNVRLNGITAIDNQGSHTMAYGLSRDATSMDVQASGLKVSGALTANANNFTYPNRLDDALDVGGDFRVKGTPYSPVPYSNIQILTASSGTWTPPANITQIFLQGCGGGAGGGGVANAVAAASSGSTAECWQGYLTVTPSSGISYTVGAKGTGGAAGNNNGTDGGNSTFGSITLSGGTHGVGSASGNAAVVLTTSTLLAARHDFTPTTTLQTKFSAMSNGNGGAAAQGGVGVTNQVGFGLGGAGGVNAAGGNATGYGNSGGGASSTSSGAFAGGDGSPGVWIVHW